MRRAICLLAAIAILTAGCTAKPKPEPIPQQPKAVEATPAASPAPTEPPAQAQNAIEGNILYGTLVQVGETVVGMKITSLKIDQEVVNDYAAYVGFKGKATISGSFKCMQDDEFLGDEIVFEVDEKSKDRLPRLAHDERRLWFTFDNRDEAARAFGPPGSEGTAIVTIDKYQINYAHTEIWNTAELVKAENISKK